MNTRLLVTAVIFGVLFLVVTLALSLWPSPDEPEVRVDAQHAAEVTVAEVYRYFDSLTTTTSSTTTTTVAPVARSAPKPAPHVHMRSVGDRVDALAACESNMNPRAYNPAGPYLSFYQWSMSTWRKAGGTGHPFDAPYATQKQLAIAWAAKTSWGSQWPVCSRRVGLR